MDQQSAEPKATEEANSHVRSQRRTLMALVGPGLLLAASGVGAGDLAGAAFAGMRVGTVILWAALCGAFFKFVVTEGLARWQLATGTTLLEGAVLRLGQPVLWLFLVYLLTWTLGVGSSLMSACGVATHALIPIFADASQGKLVWGIGLSIVGVGLVWWGSFRFIERLMGLLVVVMVVVVLVTSLLVGPNWSAVFQGLVWPTIPNQPDGVEWTLALMGGIGGTLTVLCYGYWIREEGRTGTEDLRLCRIDLALSYFVMALFGVAMVIIATGMTLSGSGATLLVDLAARLEASSGYAARLLFLAGAWAAVFSSLLGVWQAAPYLFADAWQLVRQRRELSAATFHPQAVDTRGRAYRGYLLFLAFAPMFGMRFDFELVQKVNSVFGALVMPLLAVLLFLLNGREVWVGRTYRNRWWNSLLLITIVVFFIIIGGPELLAALGF